VSREIVPPAKGEHEDETHPAFGLIGASRVQTGADGAVLFDSDIKHRHTVIVRVQTARRKRDLHRDWIGTDQRGGIVELEMSEAQWASFVSSMNTGDGVSCTIRSREGAPVPGLPHEPRLHESISEVRGAAEKAFEKVKEAFAAVEENPTKKNIRHLKFAIENAPSNVAFAGESLTEHAENVVQKARADVEAMVEGKAAQYGLKPGDLGGTQLLGEGEGED
jgi:hypothetical protein